MAREPLDYWEKRQTDLMKRLEKGTEKTINSLVQAYEKATKNINKEIVKIYNNFAKDAGLSKKVLTQLLSSRETEQYYKNLLQVIKNNITDENIKKKLLAKYNAPAYAYRISRYEQLQQNIDLELKKLANIEQQITEIRYVDTIKEGYYHNIYNVQKAVGVGFNFSQIDDKTINLLLNEKWTNNANFSQRIWKNSEKLGNYLRAQLTADTMSGKSIQKIASELSSFMNVGLYNATTLVRTEVNHFANEAEMLSYEELGIEKYRFIATLDNVTCKHCAELDNKIFDLNDRQPGKNYPPIHPNDRCTTVAVFDDDVTEGLQRRAKDENGKTILVPQDMNYQQWHEKYVEGSDYVVKSVNNYRAINEKLAIKQAIKLIPNKYNNLLKDIKFDIITQGTSGVKGNTIYILKGADKHEVIHEIGHIMVDKLRINNDYKFINIINNTLHNLNKENIIFDPETFAKGIFRIESHKFVTEYQGRIYQSEGFTFGNGKLNYKAFRDYFPEGLRMYYQDKKLLKRRNLDLYNYIKELMSNGKNI